MEKLWQKKIEQSVISSLILEYAYEMKNQTRLTVAIVTTFANVSAYE